jgi:spore maturation protein CgeB
LKILMIQPGPAFSVADVHRGWTKALAQIGCQVADLAFGDRINFYAQAHRVTADGDAELMLDNPGVALMAGRSMQATCYELQPDVVIVTSGFYTHPAVLDSIRAHGTPVVVLHTESPYEDDRQVALAAHATLNIVNDPTNIDRFRAEAPTEYFPHAYDPDIHYPGPVGPEFRSDFCFVGTGFPSRVEFFEQVDFTGIDVALAGMWCHLPDDSPLRKHLAHNIEDCCGNDQAADLYRGGKVSANLYRRETTPEGSAAGWAMGPREVELAACGTFFLRDPRPESDEVLGMLPTFDGPEDFTQKLRWYLHHGDVRSNLACQARQAVADRTFTASARRLLTLLETH